MTNDQSLQRRRPSAFRIAALVVSPAIVAVVLSLFVGYTRYGDDVSFKPPPPPAGASPSREVEALRAAYRVLAAVASTASAAENARRDALDKARLEEAKVSADLATRRAELRAAEALTSPDRAERVREAEAALTRATEQIGEVRARLQRAAQDHEAAQQAKDLAEKDAAAAARVAERIGSDEAARRAIEREVARVGLSSDDDKRPNESNLDWAPVLAALVTGLFGVLSTWLAYRRGAQGAEA